MKTGILFTLLFIISAPDLAAAQLVTCEGVDCTACDFVSMVNGVVNFLITLSVVFAVIMLAVAGFKMLTSGGNANAASEARGIFTNVVIGFIIILSAWLIIDTILRIATNTGGLDAWGLVDCGGLVQPRVGDPTGLEGPEAGTVLNPRSSAGCPTCVDISTAVSCKNSRSCTAEAEFGERLAGLARVSAVELEVTEGFPPTRTHQAGCHGDGTCVDIVFKDRNWTPERVKAFQAQAKALGFRAVYEPGKGESCAGYSECVPFEKTKATASHFSLYAN